MKRAQVNNLNQWSG